MSERSHCEGCPIIIQARCSQPPNERFICLRDQAHGSTIDINRPSTWMGSVSDAKELIKGEQ